MHFKLKIPGFIIFMLFGVCFLKFGTLVNAQVPPPNTTCTSGDPEFNSLRPYQASPCQTAIVPSAKFCGNTLSLQDKISVAYQPGIDNCSALPGGNVRCSYVLPVSEKIIIDLSNAKLPIMGNTENVPSSQNPTGTPPSLTDAEKVNGYVSWYLNGVMNRAEDGSSKNIDSNIINFSGPINKLLPSAIQDAQRIQTITNVGAGQNHNQIAVCVNNGKPTACYLGNNTPAQGTVYRLNDWNDGKLSLVTTFFNWLGTDIWNKKYPPLPWQFKSEVLYDKAYSEWRGNSCIIVPIVNKVVCAALPIISNPSSWSNLFPYIPLSSTEDVKGSIQVDSVSVGGPGITNVSFNNQVPSTLFFPHLTESDQLGSTLQNTYLPSGQAGTGAPTGVEDASNCTTIDVRSNNGDKLFATPLSGNLNYTASFTCDFNPITGGTNTAKCKACLSEGNTPIECGTVCNTGPISVKTCTKDVSISLSTTTSVPKIDDVWSRLVAGPTAVIKRLFPQLGTQIGTLKDLPGSTAITYTGAQASSAQLNLPHVGGISEYFLKGIQTLLRPKGYGEPVVFGLTTLKPSEKVDCDKSAPNITLPHTIGKQDLHALAIRLEGGKTGDKVLECYNDVARKSLAAGISPAFTFLLWINESGGSNYTISNQDWGINNSQVKGFNAQLTRFLQLPAAYKSNYPQCFGKTRTDTEAFLDLYYLGLQGGQCVPGGGQNYVDLFNSLWGSYTTCPFTGFPFSSSCY
jgi:hypothetical protein